jgi:acetoin:2,6-dichlorophenolindophenol oxidoreductase subunit beta
VGRLYATTLVRGQPLHPIYALPVALGAATMLEEEGISAEVMDPRTTWPLDKQALIDSAKKTSRALVVDEGYERYGVTAEIASVIAEGDRAAR